MAKKNSKNGSSGIIVEIPQGVLAASEHRHSTYMILKGEVPDAQHCRSHRPGAGIILHVECACGMRGYLEVPAADAEVMAQTAAWDDDALDTE